MDSKMAEKQKTNSGEYASHGVEILIERLRNEGVVEGKSQAEALIAEAREKSADIQEQAQAEADSIIANARKKADALKAAGQDALELAARDTHLKLRETIMERFSGEVSRLVGTVMEPENFMEKLVLQVAGRVSEQAELGKQNNFSIKLPEDVVGIEDLRKNPEELKEGTLAHFVLSVMAGLLREGIDLQTTTEFDRGIKVYLKKGDVEVDLTDQAITAVLLDHLQPRFRALLEGVVK